MTEMSTIPLQALIDAAEQRKQARQAAEDARKAQAAQDQNNAAVERLRAPLTAALGENLMALLAVEVLPDKAGFAVKDDDGNEQYLIVLDSETARGERFFGISALDAKSASFLYARERADDLPDALLLFIRDSAAKFAALIAKAAAEADAKAQRLADNLADHEREQRDRANRIAAENVIDAEIAAEVEAARAAHPLFVWAEGVSLIYYHLRWVTGERSDEGYAEYDSGYSLSDALDADGYITVYNYAGARRLKLNMQVHKPVWEIKTAARSAELPSDLVETDSVVIVGIKEHWSSDQRRNVWVRDADASSALLIGEQPVEAVRQTLGCRSAQ